jgi:hypothetical protein
MRTYMPKDEMIDSSCGRQLNTTKKYFEFFVVNVEVIGVHLYV